MPYMIADGDPLTVSSTQGHTVQLSNQPSWVPEVLVNEVQALGARMAPLNESEPPTVVITRKIRAKTTAIES